MANLLQFVVKVMHEFVSIGKQKKIIDLKVFLKNSSLLVYKFSHNQ